jgi:hypothetical protein
MGYAYGKPMGIKTSSFLKGATIPLHRLLSPSASNTTGGTFMIECTWGRGCEMLCVRSLLGLIIGFVHFV